MKLKAHSINSIKRPVKDHSPNERRTIKYIERLEDKISLFLTELDREPMKERFPIAPLTTTQRLDSKTNRSLNLSRLRQARLESQLVGSFKKKLKCKPMKLMEQTNAFEKQETHRKNLMKDIGRELSGVKKPCIDTIVTTVLNKESLYSHYKEYGRNHHSPKTESRSPENMFSKAVLKGNTSPIPVHSHIKNSELNLTRYNMNESLCKALSESLPIYLRKIALEECGVSDTGGFFLLQGISQLKDFQSFTYSKNNIGEKFIEGLGLLSNTDIIELNLNASRFNGPIVKKILQGLITIKSLEKIGLSSLGLTDFSCKYICKLLRNKNITDIDLSCNQLSIESSFDIIKRLVRCKNVKFFNYSDNKLTGLGSVVAKLIQKHTSLMHLDLSHNKLNEDDINEISKGISKSSCLIGVHLSGNSSSTETLNDMAKTIPAKIVNSYRANSAFHTTFPFELANSNMKPKKKDLVLPDDEVQEVVLQRNLEESAVFEGSEWKMSDKCWICERWNYFKLNLKRHNLRPLNINYQSSETSVVLKSSFNNWTGITLENELNICLLLPPGKHFIYFLDNSQLWITPSLTYQYWNGVKVNVIDISPRKTPIDLVNTRSQIIKKVFLKEKSIFRHFIEDNEERRRKMFEADKKYFKLGRMIKKNEDLISTCDLLVDNYPSIKEIFDYYAAISNYPTITMLDFSRFCDETKMIDHVYINHSAIDRLFIATNFEEVSLDENPDRELCRYEFLEILVRIATTKYKDLRLSPKEATAKLMDEHVMKYANFSKASEFRNKFLYIIEVNDLLEHNFKNIQRLFFKYKGRNGKWLTLDAVKALLTHAGIKIQERELVKCYAFSKMSVIDENNSGGSYQKLVFVEFLEFIARAADLVVEEETVLVIKLQEFLKILFNANRMRLRLPTQGKGSDSSDTD